MDPATENQEIDFLHEIGTRIAAADPLHEVLEQIVNFVPALVKCISYRLVTGLKRLLEKSKALQAVRKGNS
jgi:uroporphyrinogen-III synthase